LYLLLITKRTIIVATRHDFWAQKCSLPKILLRLGSAPNPAGDAHSPPRSPSWIWEPLFNREGRGTGRKGNGNKGEDQGGEGRESRGTEGRRGEKEGERGEKREAGWPSGPIGESTPLAHRAPMALAFSTFPRPRDVWDIAIYAG